jgi:glutamine synthetase
MLRHLPAILAFTFAQDASYERVREGIWAGGVWVAWGQQNRETPIRKVDAGHWEIKSLDGLANVYLAMAAVVGGGYLGLREEMELSLGECNVDPATLSTEERTALGITTLLPKSLEESLAALEADEALQELMGKAFVRRYVGVRRGEKEMLDKMGKEERRRWLIERY